MAAAAEDHDEDEATDAGMDEEELPFNEID